MRPVLVIGPDNATLVYNLKALFAKQIFEHMFNSLSAFLSTLQLGRF